MTRYDTSRVSITVAERHSPLTLDLNEDECAVEDLGELLREVMIENRIAYANVTVEFRPVTTPPDASIGENDG